MNVSEITDLMESNGLPYRLDEPSQVVGAIATKGDSYAVLCTVKEDEMHFHTFVGYYADKDFSDELAGTLSRMRKVEVIWALVM